MTVLFDFCLLDLFFVLFCLRIKVDTESRKRRSIWLVCICSCIWSNVYGCVLQGVRTVWQESVVSYHVNSRDPTQISKSWWQAHLSAEFNCCPLDHIFLRGGIRNHFISNLYKMILSLLHFFNSCHFVYHKKRTCFLYYICLFINSLILCLELFNVRRLYKNSLLYVRTNIFTKSRDQKFLDCFFFNENVLRLFKTLVSELLYFVILMLFRKAHANRYLIVLFIDVSLVLGAVPGPL